MGDRVGADPGAGAQPVQLLLLEGVRLLPPAAGLGARDLVGTPPASEASSARAVGAQCAGVEVHEVGAHVVEQDPVVAGQQDHPRKLAQEAREHLDRVVVEVVGRLVEQQAARAGRHDRGEGEPGALAAGQGAHGPCGVEAVEPEACCGLRRPSVGVPRVVAQGELEGLLVGPRALDRGDVSGEALDVGHRPAQRCERHGEDLLDRRRAAERRLLAQQHQVVGCGDGAGHPGSGRQPSRDGTQEGRLADAVLADEADAPTGLGDEVHTGQHGAVEVGHRQSGDDDRGEWAGRHAEDLRRGG